MKDFGDFLEQTKIGELDVKFQRWYLLGHHYHQANIVWCSEIGSLASLDAPELHAYSDVKEPISLHHAVHTHIHQHHIVLTSLKNMMLAMCVFAGRLHVKCW